MVKLLDPTDIDPIIEQVEEVMDATESEAMAKRFAYTPDGSKDADLSDKTKFGEVTIRPSRDKRVEKGRPAARAAWTWNGTETVLPLAWNPEGNRHDGARHYLLKRHCLCCHSGGFFGMQCKNCARNNCQRCKGSTDFSTEQVLENGKTVKGWIIPNFYLRKEDVPFQARFYGKFDCFLPFCPRRGGMGFLTEQDMRVHARSRHRMEYQAHIESQTVTRSDQVDALQRRVDDLMGKLAVQGQAQARLGVTPLAAQLSGVVLSQAVQAAPQQTPAQMRMAKARAAKKRAAVGVA